MERWGLVAAQLKKFTVADLLEKVRKLNIFPADGIDEELENLKYKDEIIKIYLEALQSSVTSKEALQHLHLFYLVLHPTTKVWTIYELKDKFVDQNELGFDPDSLQTSLTGLLNDSAATANVAVQMHAGMFWLRIEIKDKVKGRRKKVTASTFFGVYKAEADNIALAGVKLVHLPNVVKALGAVLNFDKAEVTAIKDRSLKGIFQLYSEKGNAKFRNFNVAIHPLPAKPTLDVRIRDLQQQEKNERKRYSDSTFGVDNKPPIKKLTFQLSTPFVKSDRAPEIMKRENKLFNCRITFEGKNVINGLQNAVECGIARTPLPSYLANVRTSGKTNFLIRPRQ